MPPTQPCLMLTRRTWSEPAHRSPWCDAFIPGQRYRLGSRFKPDGISIKA